MANTVEVSALRVQATAQVSKGVQVSTTDSRIPIIERELHELEQRVDELITFDTHYDFPSTGTVGNLYVATDEEVIYMWDGDKYVAISGIDALQRQIAEINGGGS